MHNDEVELSFCLRSKCRQAQQGQAGAGAEWVEQQVMV